LVASAVTIGKKDDLPSQKLDADNDAYLTKVMEKYTLPGKDADGEENGKRVLSKPRLSIKPAVLSHGPTLKSTLIDKSSCNADSSGDR